MSVNTFRVNPGDFRKPLRWLYDLEAYRQERLGSKAPPRETNLRLGRQRQIREIWHGALFGLGYALIHRLDTLELSIAAEENDPCDVRFRWSENNQVIEAPVQLKELPPAELNAGANIQMILEKAAIKYSRASNLILAIYLNRTESLSQRVSSSVNVNQLWFWGWSKPDRSEIFLAGGRCPGY